jgi:hypothetical protein
MSAVTKSHGSILTMPLKFYPIGILDYFYVSTLYILSSLFVARIIDGIILPPFNDKKAATESTIKLVFMLAAVVSMQGFFACVIITLLHILPSPINGLFGYNIHSPIGAIVRNPAIITLLLFMMNDTVRGTLPILLTRSKTSIKIV